MTGPESTPPRSAVAALRNLLVLFHAETTGGRARRIRHIARLDPSDVARRLTELADLERADAAASDVAADVLQRAAVADVATAALGRIAALTGREGTSLESIVDRVAYLAGLDGGTGVDTDYLTGVRDELARTREQRDRALDVGAAFLAHARGGPDGPEDLTALGRELERIRRTAAGL